MTLDLRYQKRNTVIHNLNPAVTLAWGCSLIVLSLIFDDPIYIMVLFIAIILMVALSEIWREWISILKLCIWLGISIIVINALVSYNGVHVLLAAPFQLPVLGRPVITLEAIAFGIVMAMKLMVVISAFTLINLTVHPDDIMLVLLKMRLPQKSVLVTSLSTRFVPCLVEDIQRISDAYRTRGVQLDTGNWITKLKKRAGIIIPLITNSLNRSIQVAEAMEARAFGTGQKRKFYKDIKFSCIDLMTLTAGFAPLAIGITLRIMKYGSYQFYPTLETINPRSSEWVLPVMVSIVLIAIVPLAFLKRRIELD